MENGIKQVPHLTKIIIMPYFVTDL